MPVHCIVPACPSSELLHKELAFFKIPDKDVSKRQKWLDAIRLDDTVPKNAKICELHFAKQFLSNAAQRKRLTADAVPTGPTHTVEVEFNPSQCTTYNVVFNNGQMLRLFISPTTEPIPKLVTIPAKQHIAFIDSNKSSSSSLATKRSISAVEENLETGVQHKKPKLVAQKSVNQAKCRRRRNRFRSEYISLKIHKKLLRLGKVDARKHLVKKFSKLFSPTQIKTILTGKRARYSSSDIANAIALRYKSNPYQELLARNFPFPSERTIQRYLKDLDFKPGLQHSVLEVLQSSFKEKSRLMKQAVIGMDEMSMSSKYELENSSGKIVGGSTNLHVIVLRGLFYSWKQVIYYDFDKKFTKEEFENIICQVEGHGFDVRAVVTDLGSTNTSLRKKLGISVEYTIGTLKIQNAFKSPTKSTPIYFFANIPHMIKLLRNHVLNNGLVIPVEDSKTFVLNKSFLKGLIKKENNSELKAGWKLTSAHLNLSQLDKMRVKYAAHLFSGSVAKYAAYSYPEDTTPAEFIECISNGFDSFNARHLSDPEPLKKPYGLALNLQNRSLDKLFKTMLNCRVVGSKTLLPFQKGILLSIASFKQLYNELKSSSLGIDSLFGSHLTTDCVENLFSQVRSFGGNNTNPTATETKRRLMAVF